MTSPAAIKKFGAYEILYELKSGGMGSVLLARRRGPGAFEQLVALKTIRAEYAQAEHVRAMFLDEAAILARLNHPGVATVHDFGEENGTLYMVMEYVAGISFRDLAELRPPPQIVARLIAEACRGLNAAHELRDLAGHSLGLVHRDISPDNLMLGYDGHVKVIDFGIALIKNRQAPVTEFGTVKGKPPYMSPEQVKNEPLDRRSDVFSLGIVAWEMLAREPLFDGDTIFAIAYAVNEKQLVPPSRVLGAPLPLGLDAAVMNALDRELATRTPTAAALAEQLEQVLQAGGGETLEGWAERELDAQRIQHRAWLAEVVAGTTAVALPARGRATGSVTEVAAVAPTLAAPLAPGAGGDGVPAVAAVVPGVHTEPGPGTSIGRTRDADDPLLDVPPRRSRLPLLLALLVLLVGGGAAVVKLAGHGDAPAAVIRDARAPLDARAVIPVPPPGDAAPAPPPVEDAAIGEDAAVHTVARDAGVHHAPRVDAGAARPMAIDAALAAPPPAAGSGKINVRYKPGPYANISIDNGGALPGPIFGKKIAAGRHTIRFLDAQTGDVLDTQTIEVTDGATVSVIER